MPEKHHQDGRAAATPDVPRPGHPHPRPAGPRRSTFLPPGGLARPVRPGTPHPPLGPDRAPRAAIASTHTHTPTPAPRSTPSPVWPAPGGAAATGTATRDQTDRTGKTLPLPAKPLQPEETARALPSRTHQDRAGPGPGSQKTPAPPPPSATMGLHTADGVRKYLTAGERDAFLRQPSSPIARCAPCA